MCYSRFCTSQRKMMIPLYSNIGATLFHIALAIWLLRLDISPILAISLASSAQFMMRLVITKVLMKLSRNFDQTLTPFWAEETFDNLKYQISLSFKSLSLGVWGFWALDIFTLMSSYMS